MTGKEAKTKRPLPLRERERDRVRATGSLTQRARALRKQATDAERLLWHYLRGRNLAGFKFRRQVVLKPYIVDFVCLEARLIVEADGGQHLEQVAYDTKRIAHLEAAGFRVMRFWNHDILADTEYVLEQIYGALVEPPSPRPSP